MAFLTVMILPECSVALSCWMALQRPQASPHDEAAGQEDKRAVEGKEWRALSMPTLQRLLTSWLFCYFSHYEQKDEASENQTHWPMTNAER